MLKAAVVFFFLPQCSLSYTCPNAEQREAPSAAWKPGPHPVRTPCHRCPSTLVLWPRVMQSKSHIS